MQIYLELYELKNLCRDMAALGVATYKQEQAPAQDYLSQREAYRQFSEGRVKRWIKDDLIKPVRDGSAPNSKRRYSRAELMAIDNAERLQYYCNRYSPIREASDEKVQEKLAALRYRKSIRTQA